MDRLTQNEIAIRAVLNCMGYRGMVEYRPRMEHMMMGGLIEKTNDKLEREEALMRDLGGGIFPLSGRYGGVVDDADVLWGGLVAELMKTEPAERVDLLEGSKKTRLVRLGDYADMIEKLYEDYPEGTDRRYIDCTDGLNTSALKIMLLVGAVEPDKLAVARGKLRLFQMGKLCGIAEYIYRNPIR